MIHFQDTIHWYDSHADVYAKLTQENYQEDRIKAFVSLVKPHGFVLDAGCANGRDSKILSERGLLVAGIDASKKLITIARKNVSNVTFTVGNFVSLPYPDNSFDAIWAHASLVHMETIADVKKALKEFHRVLRPQGLLYLYVRSQKQSGQTVTVDGRFYRYFSEKEITDFLTEVGFTIQELFSQKEHDRPGKKSRDITWMTIYTHKN